MTEEQPNPPHHHSLCSSFVPDPSQCRICKGWDHSQCSWCVSRSAWRPADEDLIAMGLNPTKPDTWPHHGLCSKWIVKLYGALTCSCRRFWGEAQKPKCIAGGCVEARELGHALCTDHLREI